ncbi:MAG TPA: hypothetical protein VFO01_14500 [Trebonia sp.]|nr:hypothetical protein [Trebonia sp.]
MGYFTFLDQAFAQLARERSGTSAASLLEQGASVLTAVLDGPATAAAFLEEWSKRFQGGEVRERGQSQLHNNGFSKISLLRFGQGWNLRLHFWPTGYVDSRIHDHRWSFWSMTLAGAITARNFVIDDRTLQRTTCVRLYDAAADGSKKIEVIEPAGLRCSGSYELAAGHAHLLDYRDPHRVANTGTSPAVTLMLSAPAERDFSHSYGSRGPSPQLAAPPRLDDAAVVQQVAQVTELLAAAGEW